MYEYLIKKNVSEKQMKKLVVPGKGNFSEDVDNNLWKLIQSSKDSEKSESKPETPEAKGSLSSSQGSSDSANKSDSSGGTSGGSSNSSSNNSSDKKTNSKPDSKDLSFLGSEKDRERLHGVLSNIKGSVTEAENEEEKARKEYKSQLAKWDNKNPFMKLLSKMGSFTGMTDKGKLNTAERNYLKAQRGRTLLEETHKNAVDQMRKLGTDTSIQKRISEINKDADNHKGFWAYVFGKKDRQQANIQRWKNEQMENLYKEHGIVLDADTISKRLRDTGLYGEKFSNSTRTLVYIPSFNFSRTKLTEAQAEYLFAARRHAAEASRNFSGARELVHNGRFNISPKDVQYLNDKTFYREGISPAGVPPGQIGVMPDGSVRNTEDFINSYGRSHQGQYIANAWSPVFSYGAAALSNQLGLNIDPAIAASYGSMLSENLGEKLGAYLGGKAPGNVIASRNPAEHRSEMALRSARGRDYMLPSSPDELAYLNLMAKARSGSPYWNDIKSTVLPQFIGDIGRSLQSTFQDLSAYSRIREARRRAGVPY